MMSAAEGVADDLVQFKIAAHDPQAELTHMAAYLRIAAKRLALLSAAIGTNIH